MDGNDNVKLQIQFLSYAINDISNYIRFIDTKIAVILTFTGVLITAIVNIREGIPYLFNHRFCVVMVLGWLLIICLVIALIRMLYFAIKTINVRMGRLNHKSKWFFQPCQHGGEEDFNGYVNSVLQMKDTDIVRDMSAELYKLNDIYSKKIYNAGKAVDCTKVLLFCIVTLILLLVVVDN